MTNDFNNGLNSEKLRSILRSLAAEKKVKQWDLGASCSKDHFVQVDKGEAKQLKASQRSSITIRVWNNDGLVGTTSTSDLSKGGIEKAFVGAFQASQFGNPNDIPDFSPLAKSELPKLSKKLYSFKGIKKLLELLRTAEYELLNKHHAIQNIPYNGLAESEFQRIYLNSEGASRNIKSTHANLYLYARAEENNNKPRSSGAIRIANGIDELDINGCIEEAAKRTIDHLNYRPIDTGKYLVCFTPEAFIELIGAFSNMFNARAVIDGVSLSTKESLGTKISVEELSIYDDSIHPSNVNACSFDGEGTPTKKLCLINKGILENFVHSESTAKQFGVSPTGHAGMGSKVSVGIDWLVISGDTVNPSKSKFNHKEYKDKFILIEGLNALHAGVKGSQGSFSLPFNGWIVDQGQRISIEAATVAGDIREVLNNIIHIEKEQQVTHQGISPHVWVDRLSITGEE